MSNDAIPAIAAPPSPSVPPAAGAVRPVYTGERLRIFLIAFGRMLLTIVTLGIGRFWMITRLRRYYWSSIKVDGAPLEYTGTAIEKLIGFLIAVVVLAVYLVVINLALSFVGISVFQGHPLALQLPLLALVPLIFWARYRAIRYLLARTRWRGIRFGLLPGAWGYTGRALLWMVLSMLTLGLLTPVAQMKLSRYVTNRSFFGDLRFEQRGGSGPLMRSWLLVWAPMALLITIPVVMLVSYAGSIGEPGALFGPGYQTEPAGPPSFGEIALMFGGVTLGMIATCWIVFALIRYQVFSFRYIYGNKVLDGRTSARISLSTFPVMGVFVIGWLVIGVCLVLALMLMASIGFGLLAIFGVTLEGIQGALGPVPSPDMLGLVAIAFFAVIYLPVLALGSGLNHALINQPLLAAAVESTEIDGMAAAAQARQRPHDESAEAGGFADALGADIGGGL